MATVPQPLRVPTLHEIAADPKIAFSLPLDIVSSLLNQCETASLALKAAFAERLRSQVSASVEQPGDLWISADEAAQIMGVDPSWMYRHKHRFKFRQPTRKTLRFLEASVRKGPTRISG